MNRELIKSLEKISVSAIATVGVSQQKSQKIGVLNKQQNNIDVFISNINLVKSGLLESIQGSIGSAVQGKLKEQSEIFQKLK